MSTAPDATSAALPDDDPPASGTGSQGLRTGPVRDVKLDPGEAQVLAHRLAGDGGAGGEQSGDHRGVPGRDEALQRLRAVHHRHPGHHGVVLDRHRAAGQRTVSALGDLGPDVPRAQWVVIRVVPLPVVTLRRGGSGVERLERVPAREQPGDERGELRPLFVGQAEPVVLGDRTELTVVRWPNGHRRLPASGAGRTNVGGRRRSVNQKRSDGTPAARRVSCAGRCTREIGEPHVQPCRSRPERRRRPASVGVAGPSLRVSPCSTPSRSTPASSLLGRPDRACSSTSCSTTAGTFSASPATREGPAGFS